MAGPQTSIRGGGRRGGLGLEGSGRPERQLGVVTRWSREQRGDALLAHVGGEERQSKSHVIRHIRRGSICVAASIAWAGDSRRSGNSGTSMKLRWVAPATCTV